MLLAFSWLLFLLATSTVFRTSSASMGAGTSRSGAASSIPLIGCASAAAMYDTYAGDGRSSRPRVKAATTAVGAATAAAVAVAPETEPEAGAMLSAGAAAPAAGCASLMDGDWIGIAVGSLKFASGAGIS